MKGRRDEHNGGAGRNSGEPITMALLGDTAEDVTERNGRTQRRNTTWSRVKKRGRRETERGTVQTEREVWVVGGGQWSQPRIRLFICCSERASCHWVQVDYGMPCHQIVISL